ncbi:MAG: ethylbenzene dehydrogenase-related protein [Halopseudomonas sp.]
MRPNTSLSRLLIALALLPFISATVWAQTIQIHPLTGNPALNIESPLWNSLSSTSVPLKSNSADYSTSIDQVLIKAGHFDNQVFFYLEWHDDTEDLTHKPYVWDNQQQRYIQGTKREDRLALQFEISGEFDADWISGKEFIADMWHWKSYRSNSLGLAHDKLTQISKSSLLRSHRATSRDGTPLYLLRPSDAGNPLYTSQRYRHYSADEMPKYKLLDNASGSVTDIKANGIWKKGRWQLIMSRQLNTGHSDDVVFELGKKVRGGIAIFDHSENHQHMVSETLNFQF